MESPPNCLSSATFGSKIGLAVPELWLKNVGNFRGRGDEVASKIGSQGLVFPLIAFKLSGKMDIGCRHVSLRKKEL